MTDSDQTRPNSPLHRPQGTVPRWVSSVRDRKSCEEGSRVLQKKKSSSQETQLIPAAEAPTLEPKLGGQGCHTVVSGGRDRVQD